MRKSAWKLLFDKYQPLQTSSTKREYKHLTLRVQFTDHVLPDILGLTSPRLFKRLLSQVSDRKETSCRGQYVLWTSHPLSQEAPCLLLLSPHTRAQNTAGCHSMGFCFPHTLSRERKRCLGNSYSHWRRRMTNKLLQIRNVCLTLSNKSARHIFSIDR